MCLNKRVELAELAPIIEETIKAGGSAVFNIHGSSMEPLFWDGKTAVRLTAPPKEINKYDIVFYRRDNGAFVLHRVIGKKQQGLVCRGDNQTEKEYPVALESVIGIVSHYTKGEKEKPINGFWQRLYARIWVNCTLLCRIKWKFDKKRV